MKITMNTFLKTLNQISGDKIVTLSNDNDKTQTFDVFNSGKIGYDQSHQLLFYILFQTILSSRGSVIIRQFLPISATTLSNGFRIPKKNLYGAFISHGDLKGLTASELRDCFSFDQNGKQLELEKDVFFRPFPTIIFEKSN